jgi:hypothetical protein
MATLQERHLGYHSTITMTPKLVLKLLELGTSRILTLHINHSVAWGIYLATLDLDADLEYDSVTESLPGVRSRGKDSDCPLGEPRDRLRLRF